MASVKVRINSSGAKSVMNSPGVQSDLLARAERVAASADAMGSGKYVADVRPGKARAHARAKTADANAFWSNRKHNALVKSLGAGK